MSSAPVCQAAEYYCAVWLQIMSKLAAHIELFELTLMHFSNFYVSGFAHQKKMRRMLAKSSTRQTLVEKPSLLLLLWISWYCGTYGRAPPNTMRQDASQDSNVHEPSMSSSCRTASASITPRGAQGRPVGPGVALGRQQMVLCP